MELWRWIMGSVLLVLSYVFLTLFANDPPPIQWPCVRVAVYEHIPLSNDDVQTPREIINANLKFYSKAVHLASKEDVQFIVFPEDSLINSEHYSRQRLINEILEEMPNPDKVGPLVNPCLETVDSSVVSANESVLRTMSCLAQTHQMYVALSFGDKVPCDANLDCGCPKDGHYLYNTIALFDNGGNFVAKYHKMQLYYEFQYNVPSDCATHSNPVVFHDTPFGRIGFMVCFDLMFRLPGIMLVEKYKINTIVYSTYFFNYLPFNSAVQLQQAFAMTHQVNFLASDVQVPYNGSFGAGIFSGKRGAIAYSNRPDGKSKLIIATIPTNCKATDAQQKCPANDKKIVLAEQGPLPHGYLHLNVSLLKMIPLKHIFGHDYVEYCCPFSSLCCNVYYRVQNVRDFLWEHFVLLVGNVTSGALGQERYPIRQEFCGVSVCKDSQCSEFADTSKTRFETFELNAKMQSKYIFPSVMIDQLQLLPLAKWRYQGDDSLSNGWKSITVTQSKHSLVAVTMYGRLYDQDPPYKH